MKQVYNQYSEEDFEVWEILFRRQMTQLPEVASEAFLDGLLRVDFKEEEIPRFSETDKILSSETGWQLAVVPGIVPDYTFFELMSNKCFPATTWLRKKVQLDYLEEPDMFHDVFAHVPLLSNQPFVDFLEELSKIGLDYVGDDYAIELLSRVYWFTVEFGLIRENGELKIYGAGILSSAGETKYCLSGAPHLHEFDIQEMLDTPYRKDVFQTDYFITASYEQLFQSIPDVKRLLSEAVQKRNAKGVTAS